MGSSDDPCVLEQFQASSLLDAGETRDLTSLGLKDFDEPSEVSIMDERRPTDISTYDPSGYLASPDGNLIMIRKANSGRMSPVMATSARDYDEKMKVLRQENFDLRLYCYHMEQKLKEEAADQTELSAKKYTVQLEMDLAKLQKQLMDKNELLNTASSAIDSLKSENDALRRDLAHAEADRKTVSELRRRQDELLSEKDALEHELQQLRWGMTEVQFTSDTAEKSAGESSSTGLEQSYTILRQQLASSEDHIKDLAQQLAESRRNESDQIEKRDVPEIQSLKHELKSVNQRYDRAVQAIQGFLKKVSKREKEIESLKAQLAKYSEQHDGAELSFEAGPSKLNKEIQAEDKQQQENQALQTSLEAQEADIKRLSAECKSLESKLIEKEKSLKESENEVETVKARVEELTAALTEERTKELSRSADLQEKYTGLLEGMEVRLRRKEEQLEQLVDCLATRDSILVRGLHPSASSAAEALFQQLEEKEAQVRLLLDEKVLLAADFETIRRELTQQIDEQTERHEQALEAARVEAEVIQRRLADSEAMVSNLRRDVAEERSERRRYEEMAKRTENERERQLIELQVVLQEQEEHVASLTNRTEGASSALANYEAITSERVRRLEQMVEGKTNALKEAVLQKRELEAVVEERRLEIERLRSKHSDDLDKLWSDNQKMREKMATSESELRRARDMLQKSEESMLDRLERASSLLEARDRTIDNLLVETKAMSTSVGSVNASVSNADIEQVEASPNPAKSSTEPVNDAAAELHAEVARLKGLLTEKEECLERMGTPHRGVGRRLFTLHALPTPKTPADPSRLSTQQLHNLHLRILTLLQTLERTQHLQESFFGDLLTTANESLLRHQQTMAERSINEESHIGNADQSLASLSGLSFLLSRLPRTPGGLEGGNVTMTTEGVTMSEEMHDLVFERLRDQVDDLRKALALCSDQGHNLLQETSGMGAPIRLAMDDEDWSGLLRRLLKRLEAEDGGEKSTEAVHKDVRLAVHLCRQIIDHLNKKDDRSPGLKITSQGDSGKGELTRADLHSSPHAAPEADMSRTINLIRTRCYHLEEENRDLKKRLGEASMTFVSPFSTRRFSGSGLDRSRHDDSLKQNVAGLELERSALEAELQRFREVCNKSSKDNSIRDSLLNSQVDEVTERLRTMQLELTDRAKTPGTPQRRSMESSSELECEKLRSTAVDLRRQLTSRCDDVEIARLKTELSQMQQRYSITASELEIVGGERERLSAELALAEKERQAIQLELEAAREASRRLQQEMASETSRLRQEVAELSEELRRRTEIEDRIGGIRSHMTSLEAENSKIRERAEIAEAEVSRLSADHDILTRRLADVESMRRAESEYAAQERHGLLAQLEQLRSVSQQEISDVRSEKESLLSKFGQLQSQFHCSGVEAQKLATEFGTQISEMETRMSNMAAERDDLHKLLESAREDKLDMESRVSTLLKNIEETEVRLSALVRSDEAAAERIKELEGELKLRSDEFQNKERALVKTIEDLSAKELELGARIDEVNLSRTAAEGDSVRLQTILNNLKDDVMSKEKQWEQALEELQVQKVLLENENSEMRAIIAELKDMEEHLKSDHQLQQIQLGQRIEELVKAKSAMEKEEARLKVEIAELSCESENQRAEQGQKIEELEENRALLEKENARLQTEVVTLSEEIEDQKLRQKHRIKELEEKGDLLEKENTRLQAEVEKVLEESQSYMQKLGQRIRELEENNAALQKENLELLKATENLRQACGNFEQRMYELEKAERRSLEEKEDVQQENGRLRDEMSAMTADQERLVEEKEGLMDSVEVERRRGEALEKEIETLRHSCDIGGEDARTLLVLKCELERRLMETTEQVEERDKTIEILREESAEYCSRLERIKPEMKNLKSDLSSMNRHRAELKSSVERLQNRVRVSVAEQKAALLSCGIDVNSEPHTRQEDLSITRERTSELEHKLEQNANQTSEVRQQSTAALQVERDENARLKARVVDLELQLQQQPPGKPELWSKDLREMGEMVKKLEGRIRELLTENEKWKSAAKELRSKLDSRTSRLESYVKQNARLKALIKKDEEQAEDRRADLETLTSNVQVKNEAITRLQNQLKNLQRELEASRQRHTNVNNSALSDLSQESGMAKELPRRARTSFSERPLTPALSDVLSSVTGENEEAEMIAFQSVKAKLRATEFMNRSLQAELSLHSSSGSEEWTREYLVEVRNLRANLEASIIENDRLREALERQLCHSSDRLSTRADRELKRLKERLMMKKKQLMEADERAELLQSEAELLRTELQSTKELLCSVKAELELCRPREGSVRREIILESQRLRLQMERSIESNRQLQAQLKDKMSRIQDRRSLDTSVASTPRLHIPSEVGDRQEIPTRLHSSCGEVDQQTYDSFRVDSDMRLLHAIGRLDDYELVRKEIQETVGLVHSMRTRLDGLQRQHRKTESGDSLDVSTVKELQSEVKNILFILEEQTRIVSRFWVAELPPIDHKGRYYDPVTQNQLSESQAEVERLRGSTRLLQSMLTQEKQRLAETDRARSDLECALVERLSTTEQVLSVARDNFQSMVKTNEMNKTL